VLDGSAIRVQGGEEIEVKKGDLWRTPGNVPHTMRAGPARRPRARHFQPAAAGIQKARFRLRDGIRPRKKTNTAAKFGSG